MSRILQTIKNFFIDPEWKKIENRKQEIVEDISKKIDDGYCDPMVNSVGTSPNLETEQDPGVPHPMKKNEKIDFVKEPANILEEAQRIIFGDRESAYGSPLEDFSRTAKIWSGILGIEVTPKQVGLCMIGVKISRECHRVKRDNIVDIAGYAGTLEKLYRDQRSGLSDGALE